MKRAGEWMIAMGLAIGAAALITLGQPTDPGRTMFERPAPMDDDEALRQGGIYFGVMGILAALLALVGE